MAGEAETEAGGVGTAWGRGGKDLGPGESAGRAGAGGIVITYRAVPHPPTRGGRRRSRGLVEMCELFFLKKYTLVGPRYAIAIHVQPIRSALRAS